MSKIFPGNERTKLQFNLDNYEESRMMEVIQYWHFYQGSHWLWRREQGEPQQTINYAKAVVDIGVDFLMGNSFSISSKLDENKEELVPLINEIWDDNDRDLLSQELALIGGVTGDAWIEITWDENLKRVVITVLDSTVVYPFWNPHNKDEMLQCSITYPAWKKKGNDPDGADLWVNPSNNRSAELTMYRYKKVYTPEMIREYHDDMQVDEYPNPIGMIPLAHIKNLPTTHNYGMSDLKDIIGLNREFNEKLTNVSDIINYHSAPTTIIYGARATSLEKSANKIWSGLPKDARVENLELQTDLGALQKFLMDMKLAIHEVASIPQQAFGDIQPVSNTSGVALQVMYHPIVRKTKKKRLTYAKGIRDANILIIKYLDVYQVLDFKGLKNPYSTIIEFPPMLPKDELLSMQLQLEKLNAGLTSRPQVLREEYNWSEEKIDMILGEADAEKEAQMEREIGAQYQIVANNKELKQAPMGSNVETDTGAGTIQKERREAHNGSDGQGRPKIKK
ncbi:MAG: phage portal protein [Nanoarchaeota archaeon]